MNPYIGWLHEVTKLVYLVGTNQKTAQIKKLLDPNDSKNKIHFRCIQEIPSNTLTKIKPTRAAAGILRADWLIKMTQRYPQMVVFLFDCGNQSDIQAVEMRLREILKKINLFTIDVLKANNKQDVVVRIVLTVSKSQLNNALLIDKANYYMKAYEKDTFIIQEQNLARDISKYRYTWLTYLDKNYQRKLRKIQKKMEEAISIQQRISYSFKISIIREMLIKQDKQRYTDLIGQIKYNFSELIKKQLTLNKYLDMRELRTLADITLLRHLRIQMPPLNEIPSLVQDHFDHFRMRNMDPKNCHFYYYFQELRWRSILLEQVLEVLGATDQLQLLPRAHVSQWLNGLLTYLLKLATISSDILQGVQGKQVPLSQEQYVGRYDYGEVTEADVIVSEMNKLIKERKDMNSKGIQLITRFKTWESFSSNQINF